MADTDRAGGVDDRLRTAESALKRFGFSRLPAAPRATEAPAAFWVQEAGVPRRTFPVFVPSGGDPDGSAQIEAWATRFSAARPAAPRAIFVVGTDEGAESAWARLRPVLGLSIESEVSVLVVPPPGRAEAPPHFHLRVVEPKEVLRLATGIVAGLFRRAQAEEGGSPVDFEEMLQLLRGRFGIDLHRSLGVRSDEDALFVLYQLAVRDSYAPGDSGSNLHHLVLKPTGSAARVPWFAG
ncbi:MAG TPA: hypothetical protein VEH57_09085 [Thermoplasmata archaeon]|nr:hypothetical protein [Thermoplasmata archaeon]